MYYENLVVNDTLTTNGYTIYVQGTISGTGTVRHTDPATGNGQPGAAESRSGGGSAAAGGIVLIFAATWAGTFTIQSVGSVGGDGATGGFLGGFGQGGDGGLARGAGPLKGTAGDKGGGNISAGNQDDPGIVGFTGLSRNPSLGSNASLGGKGGNTSVRSGGNGGAIGIATAPNTENWSIFRFLVSALLDLNSEGALVKLLAAPSGGSGGSGASENNPSSASGGGGGAGGNGGIAVVIFNQKTWTGSSSFAGGIGGVGGVKNGGANVENGGNGVAGVAGRLIEIDWTSLL